MSWAEVFKINNNMKKPLNEQLRDLKFQPVKIITATGTYTPEKTGIYRVICIGAGGDGAINTGSIYGRAGSGGAGGVAIKTLKLLSTGSYNVTVSTTASFSYGNDSITATAGTKASATSSAATAGVGGTASGGDRNYPGGNGSYSNDVGSGKCVNPGSVGVYISDFYRSNNRVTMIYDAVSEVQLGDSLLGFGGSGNSMYRGTSGNSSSVASVLFPGMPAGIIIIPLELEE